MTKEFDYMDWWNVSVFGIIPVLSVLLVFFPAYFWSFICGHGIKGGD